MSEKDRYVGKPRTLEANRAQTRMIAMDLESMLPQDHPARAVWAFVERLDLSSLYEKIRAREGAPGRAAHDPRILLSLWLLATLEGVGASRRLERLCQWHLAYQWICGGVNMNYHTLADFYSGSEEILKELLVDCVAVLVDQGLVTLERVAQDGMKVRASAGASSFRTRERLEELREIAREQVERLAAELDADPGAASRREEAARERAATSRAERIERALDQMPEAEARKKSNNGKKKDDARVSTTDPEARVMKMADGGFRPAYNVHLVTDTGSQVIVGVKVDNQGTDSHAMAPLADQLEEHHEVMPQEWLADGGCSSLINIDVMDKRGCKVFAPLRQRRRSDRNPSDPCSTDSPAVAEWRARMGTEPAKEIYKQRAATAECVNAQARNHGLRQFLVRGGKKVLSVVLFYVLAHNMQRSWALT
jgi:transposase